MNNYSNLGDHPELEKFADLVTLNVRHDFSPEELAQESQMLAQSVNDKIHIENNKKVAMTVFKNQIETYDADIRLHASNLTHGFTYKDISTEMYRDWKAAKRVYFDKQTGDFVKDEAFHPSDFQKKLEFEEKEKAQQEQIEANNKTGDHAEGTLKYDMFNPVDEIIADKKVAHIKQIPRNETFNPDGALPIEE